MKSTLSLLATALLTTLSTAQQTFSVSYDTGYDDDSRSLSTVACSDGTNGIETRYPYTTQGQIPNFPLIGGASVIAGWNSDQCGTCWQLAYEGATINVLAIDTAPSGFNIAQKAMDALTNGQAVQLGRVEATATQVDVSNCGL